MTWTTIKLVDLNCVMFHFWDVLEYSNQNGTHRCQGRSSQNQKHPTAKLRNSINKQSLLLRWNIKFSSLVSRCVATGWVDMMLRQSRQFWFAEAKNNMIQHDEISFAFAFTVHQRLKIWFFNLLLFFFLAVPFAIHFETAYINTAYEMCRQNEYK